MIYFFLSWGNWIGLWRQGKAFLLSFYSAVTPLKPSSLKFFPIHEEKGKVVMPHRKSHQLPIEEPGNERAIKRSQMSRVNPGSSQLMGPSMPFISIRWPLMKAFFVNVPTKNSRPLNREMSAESIRDISPTTELEMMWSVTSASIESLPIYAVWCLAGHFAFVASY